MTLMRWQERDRSIRHEIGSRRALLGRPELLSIPDASHASWADLLSLREHGHQRLDAAEPRLRFLCAMHAIQDRVAVCAVEGSEERLGGWVAGQRLPEIVRDRHRA